MSDPPAQSRGCSCRISFVTALSGFIFGFDTAINNGSIVFLRRHFRWTEIETEFAAGRLLAGCALGASVAGALSDRFGREIVLLLSAVIFALSAVAAALSNGLGQFVTARIVAGIAIGIASMLAPLYIAEASPAATPNRPQSDGQRSRAGILLGLPQTKRPRAINPRPF